jgi:transposase
MLIGHPRQKVYLAVGATDLSKAVDGLAVIVQLDFELNPFESYLFAFCNRMRNKVKILEWSERGFWLHYFRLEQGKLPWPQEGEEFNPLDITWQDLRLLLEGNSLKPAEHRAVTLPKYVL